MYDAPLPLPDHGGPRGLWLGLCMLGNVILLSLGLAGLLLLALRLRSMMSVLLVVILVASLSSALQRLIWGEGSPPFGRWVVAGVIGWVLGLIPALLFLFGGPPRLAFSIGFVMPAGHVEMSVHPAWILAWALLGGVIAGACQRLLLRGYAPERWWWIPLSAVSWAMGCYLLPGLILDPRF